MLSDGGWSGSSGSAAFFHPPSDPVKILLLKPSSLGDVVHATLDAPQRWGYVFDKLAAAASFTYQNTAVCFFGHTHVPVAFMRDSVVRGGTYSKFKVEAGKKYFVNVGAVGQPRDNNPKAAYVVYDVYEGTIEIRRLEYDIAAAQKKILAAGLPERLAERLAYGR